MRIRRSALVAAVSLTLWAVGLCPGGLEGAMGRDIEPNRSGPPQSIFSTSWYRERVIQVAVGNATDKPHSLKVAIGTRDVGDHIFASFSLNLAANSIKLVYFPLIKQKTSRGDLRTADHVFIYGSDPGMSQFMAVQGLSQPLPTTDSFVASTEDKIKWLYVAEPEDSLRVFFLPRSIPVEQNLRMPGVPQAAFLQSFTPGDLSTLNLPVDYQRQLEEKLKENYGFFLKPGEGGGIALSYTIPEIKDLTVVRIADYQYVFKPDGKVIYGGGPGLAFMIYNPKVISVKPLLNLKSEEGKLPASKKLPSKP